MVDGGAATTSGGHGEGPLVDYSACADLNSRCEAWLLAGGDNAKVVYVRPLLSRPGPVRDVGGHAPPVRSQRRGTAGDFLAASGMPLNLLGFFGAIHVEPVKLSHQPGLPAPRGRATSGASSARADA
ncbi:MAG: hypothetical protein ICV73_20055 [Acetobacteraceae bacterium]|nr:hypothetical protein [Acetobacteraceae bacterium]